MKGKRRRRCKHCTELFESDCRQASRQQFCGKPECRAASHKASQAKWRAKPANKRYFRDKLHVERVRDWRKANPGYWKPSEVRKPPETQAVTDANFDPVESLALQDTCLLRSPLFIGLLSHLTGCALQDEMASEVHRLTVLGNEILRRMPPGAFPFANVPVPTDGRLSGQTNSHDNQPTT